MGSFAFSGPGEGRAHIALRILAPPTRVERATNGLGRARAVSEIVREVGDSGRLRAACLELLVAAAKGDDGTALEALDRLRSALRVGTVSEAVGLAAELLADLPAAVDRAG